MSKWMFILNHQDDLNDIVVKSFLNTLKQKQTDEGKILATHERPYLLFMVVSDTDTTDGYVSFSEITRNIYEKSQKLNFNYHILYKGRSFLDKLDQLSNKELITKIQRQINFIKPEYLFIKRENTYTCIDDLILEKILYYIMHTNRHIAFLSYGAQWEEVNHLLTDQQLFSFAALETE